MGTPSAMVLVPPHLCMGEQGGFEGGEQVAGVEVTGGRNENEGQVRWSWCHHNFVWTKRRSLRSFSVRGLGNKWTDGWLRGGRREEDRGWTGNGCRKMRDREGVPENEGPVVGARRWGTGTG
eukprot:357255-Chlamydomonas_euryale.AAC.2